MRMTMQCKNAGLTVLLGSVLLFDLAACTTAPPAPNPMVFPGAQKSTITQPPRMGPQRPARER